MRSGRCQRHVGFVLPKFLGIRQATGARRWFRAGSPCQYRRCRKQAHCDDGVVAAFRSRRSNQREKEECAVQEQRQEKARQSCPKGRRSRRRSTPGRLGIPRLAERRFIVATHGKYGYMHFALSPNCTPRRCRESASTRRLTKFGVVANTRGHPAQSDCMRPPSTGTLMPLT